MRSSKQANVRANELMRERAHFHHPNIIRNDFERSRLLPMSVMYAVD